MKNTKNTPDPEKGHSSPTRDKDKQDPANKNYDRDKGKGEDEGADDESLLNKDEVNKK